MQRINWREMMRFRSLCGEIVKLWQGNLDWASPEEL
jgi:hypothetical protein